MIGMWSLTHTQPARISLRGPQRAVDVAGPRRRGQAVRGVVGQVDAPRRRCRRAARPAPARTPRRGRSRRPERRRPPASAGSRTRGQRRRRARPPPRPSGVRRGPARPCRPPCPGGRIEISGPRSVAGRPVGPSRTPAIQVGDAGDERGVERAVHDRPGGRGAVLAGVDQAAGHRAVDRGRPGRRRRRPRTAPCRPARGGPAWRWSPRPPAPVRPTAVEPVKETIATSGWRTRCGAGGRPVAGDHVDHAVGEPGLAGDLGEQQAGQRGDLGRLEHDGVAGGDGRQDLPAPPSAAGSSTARSSPPPRSARAGCSRCGRRSTRRSPCPPGCARRRRRSRRCRRCRARRTPGQPDRLAGLAALQLGDLLGPVVEQPGEPGQDARPFGRCRTRPVPVGRGGRLDRLVDIGRGGEGDASRRPRRWTGRSPRRGSPQHCSVRLPSMNWLIDHSRESAQVGSRSAASRTGSPCASPTA